MAALLAPLFMRRKLVGKQPPPAAHGPIAAARAVVPRKLVGKQPPPAPYAGRGGGLPDDAARAIAMQAIGVEAWAEVEALGHDKQRVHVHYTHARTFSATDRQPSDFATRAEFWSHMELVYKEAYPDETSKTGSCLLFGAVAKERHAAAEDEMRDEHHHVACYCSQRHYWNKVAKISHEKYGVKLNAKAHDGYYSMYSYLSRPTVKKPLSELDAELWLSPLHPRGEMLAKLLKQGEVYVKANGRKRSAGATEAIGGVEPEQKKVRAGDIIHIARASGVKTTLELQSLANTCLSRGDPRLAEFCTAVGEDKLGQILRAATAVMNAPRALARHTASRMDLLRHASTELPCTCRGVWINGAKLVLENNAEDVGQFCRDVCAALTAGATRGTNMAVIGAPGCGKSMLFEPFTGIFDVAGKPQKNSSFALAGILDCHIMLWQDYKHEDKTLAFEDLLALLVGETLAVRVPNKPNVEHRNTAPMFFTSNSPLVVARSDPLAMQYLNTAMGERFNTRCWQVPLPQMARVANFPKCARCCATFYLQYR